MKQLEKFIRRQTYDMILFGFVTGIKSQFSTVSTTEALKLFAQYFKLEDFNLDSAQSTYSRMQNEFIAQLKQKKDA